MVDADERVKPMMEFARSIDCGNGKFVKLAFDIDKYLSNTRLKYRINMERQFVRHCWLMKV